MRFLRFSPVLVFFAACADLSGLSGLEVGDSSVVVEGGGSDTSADAPADAKASAEADADASVGFCLSQPPTAYDFCADFDEGDVTKGFVGGSPAPWSFGQQTLLPKLDPNLSVSPPASGALASGDELTFTSSASVTPTSVALTADAYATSFGTSDATLLYIQIDSTHAVQFRVTFGTVSIDEIQVLTDGGATIQPHDTQVVLKEFGWHTVVLAASASYVSFSVDSATLVGIPRTQPSPVSGSFAAALRAGGVNAVFNYDNVLITHN